MKDTRLQTPTVKVWDRFVRLFHWSLVLGVTIAAISGFFLLPTWITLHILAGTSAAVLLLFRVIWGIWGSPNARFRNFIKGPRAVLAHIEELRQGKAGRHLGHNPLGALMIIALLGAVLLLVVTGATGLGGVFKAGPAGFATDYKLGSLMLSWHKLMAILLVGLVGLHVAGALFEGWRTRENLVKAMVTGVKESRVGDAEQPVNKTRTLWAVAVFGVFLAGGVWLAIRLSALPAGGVPHPVQNPAYADECSACHIAYAPSLLPAADWGALMATLNDHFGEDASLDQATTDEITTWLRANSADGVDTKPAHVFRYPNADLPYAITQTPFWKRTHRRIPDAVFARAPIYDNGNCVACHSDADSGAFYPANIHIPKETTP